MPGCPSSRDPDDQTRTLPSPASWLVTMLIAPPSAPATHPVDNATPPVYPWSYAMNWEVIFGSPALAECSCVAVPLAWARAVGVNKSQRNDLISGASPAPGAVTNVWRP